MTKVKVGDKIHIFSMDDCGGTDLQAAQYNGKEGIVELIDDMGQLHGTWGGLAVNPECDSFYVFSKP